MISNKSTLLGMAAVMGLGLLALGGKPASADPPSKAPAWGWRSKQSAYNNNNRYRDGRFNGRYNSRNNSRYGGRATDIDRDGRDNWHDWDMDGDGIPNERDRDMDGDGIPNSRDAQEGTYNGRGSYNGGRYDNRYRGRGDADRDGVRNRRDRDIDGDGRHNWRDRDMDGDGRRNSRDRFDRNPRRR